MDDLPAGHSRYVQLQFDRAQEGEQVYASYQRALKTGDAVSAAAIVTVAGVIE